MNTEASKRLVTPKELAQILGVSERTVLSYRRIGLIPGIQLSQTTIRFDLDEVLEVLKQEPKS
jgi:DNA-binding transcriptional MerR regulator